MPPYEFGADMLLGNSIFKNYFRSERAEFSENAVEQVFGPGVMVAKLAGNGLRGFESAFGAGGEFVIDKIEHVIIILWTRKFMKKP